MAVSSTRVFCLFEGCVNGSSQARLPPSSCYDSTGRESMRAADEFDLRLDQGWRMGLGLVHSAPVSSNPRGLCCPYQGLRAVRRSWCLSDAVAQESENRPQIPVDEFTNRLINVTVLKLLKESQPARESLRFCGAARNSIQDRLSYRSPRRRWLRCCSGRCIRLRRSRLSVRRGRRSQHRAIRSLRR